MIRIGSFELVSFTNLFKFKDVEGKAFMPKMNIYSNILMDITQFRDNTGISCFMFSSKNYGFCSLLCKHLLSKHTVLISR